jgi:hypothetical protein
MQATVRPVLEVRLRGTEAAPRLARPAHADRDARSLAARPPTSTARALADAVLVLFGVQRH